MAAARRTGVLRVAALRGLRAPPLCEPVLTVNGVGDGSRATM
jgi:hypothetical protein